MSAAHDDPVRRRLGEIKRLKWQRDQAREQLAAVEPVLVRLQVDFVEARLTGRLRLELFHRFIGLDRVVGEDGMPDSGKLELALADLLRRMPELAAPSSKSVGESPVE